jgi:folate-binding protein YgfZ
MTVASVTEKLSAAGARLGEYRGVPAVVSFGNPRAEFAALREGCAVYDLGWRAKIVLTGSDRTRWLNGMITNNVRDLAPSHGVYAFLLNPQGHIQADLYAYNRGEHLLVDTELGQLEKLLGLFDHYIIMDDVEVTNISAKLTAIGVQGPGSRQLLHSVGIEGSELGPLQLVDLSWQQAGITLVRAEENKGQAYEIWLAPPNAALLWDALVQAGATPAGTEALEWFRIAAGIPRFGQDIRERDLPQETGQDRALHFTKGCYVGQEIVERIHARGQVHRIFASFRIEGTPPSPGTKIQADGKEVGEVTSPAALPTNQGDVSVALGYIRREAARKDLEIGGAPARVQGSPVPEITK